MQLMTNIVPKTKGLMASDILAEALRDMDKIIRATESAKVTHLLCDPNVATNWQFRGDSHWKTANFVHKNDPKRLSEQRIDSFISLIKFIINNPKDSSVIYSNLSVDHKRLLIRLLGELQLALDAEPSKQKAVSKMKIFRSATSPNPFTESPNSPSMPPNVTLAGDLNGHDHQSACSPNLHSPTLPLSNKGADWKQSQPAGLCVNGTDSLDNLNLLTELVRQQTQIANLEKAKRELEVQLLDLRERFAELSKPTKQHTVCTGSENNHFQHPLDEAQNSLYEPKQQPWSNGQKFNTSSSPVTSDTNVLLAKQMDDEERNRLANTPSYVTFPNSPQGLSAPTTVSNFPLVQFSLAPPGQSRTPTRGDNSINHNPYKSVSLSELHHTQFDFLDTQPFAPSVLPQFTLKKSKITGHGTSVSPSLSTVPVASAASTGTTHLPPQYANGCHRQTHLFNKSPAPALTTNTDLSRIVQTASRTLSPRPSTQTSIFSASDQAHTPVNGHQSLWTNSLVRRAKTPTERLDRSVVHPMTTSKPLCQSEVRVPMVTLNDNVELLSGYPDDANSRSAWTKANKNSRIKQFFAETRDFIHWDKDVVSAWMYELGLGYAVPATRRWLRRGADLVYASRKQIEHV
ncbi:unnamed protein product [Dicrocoelium dendriticum]|nr:unnamed protein product [Dicrocoelium dendriticum]